MSDAAPQLPDLWQPPTTFREGLRDVERVAVLLLDQVGDQPVIRTGEVRFLARRLHTLARAPHRALPPEVT